MVDFERMENFLPLGCTVFVNFSHIAFFAGGGTSADYCFATPKNFLIGEPRSTVSNLRTPNSSVYVLSSDSISTAIVARLPNGEFPFPLTIVVDSLLLGEDLALTPLADGLTLVVPSVMRVGVFGGIPRVVCRAELFGVVFFDYCKESAKGDLKLLLGLAKFS